MNNIPEHLMAQAETRKFGKREVKVIPVSGMTAKEAMVVFNCPKGTAQKTVKRGYYVVDYCKKTVIPGWFDPDEAYKMSKWVFNYTFRGRVPEWADMEDMLQDGVIRLLELGGHPRIKAPGYALRVIKTAMVSYLRRNRRQEHEDESRIDTHVYGRVSEGCQRCVPTIDTWHLKQAPTERMVRMIEARAA